MRMFYRQSMNHRTYLQEGLGLLLALMVQQSHAQNWFTIADGMVTTCSGVLYDSGGQDSTGYSNNEDYTFTICPDSADSKVILTFQTFDLDQSGQEISWDHLRVYDGNNPGYPLLGEYLGNDLQGYSVSGTVYNPTGCLTLVFSSNSIGTGAFSASIACPIPCDHPTAVADMSFTSPARICPGTAIEFDASGSTAAPGQVITGYSWRFGQFLALDTSAPTMAYVFDTPGAYPVSLIVVDSNGCGSTNAVDLQVLVGTTPSITLEGLDSIMCLGDSMVLNANVQATTSYSNVADYGEGMHLADNYGHPQASEIVLTGFPPGSTLTDLADMVSICVDMEHSFMGDLVLELFCPNGQSTVLHEQGGLSTYVGSPLDDEPGPGECWHYCWSASSTIGTWVDNSVDGTNNTTLAGTPPSGSLNPGTYEPLEIFDNLIGCPLNGTWTFMSTDLWGLDDGYLCAWELHFDPALGGDTIAFVPEYGPGCDSTFWSGSNFTWISPDCDSISTIPIEPGELTYTYTAIDNFGCSFDTTVTITVLPTSDPVCIGMGTSDLSNAVSSVYPVPTDGDLHLSLIEGMHGYEIRDTDGRLLDAGTWTKASTDQVLSLHDLPPGLYLLLVHSDVGVHRYQVLKN